MDGFKEREDARGNLFSIVHARPSLRLGVQLRRDGCGAYNLHWHRARYDLCALLSQAYRTKLSLKRENVHVCMGCR